jgi:L-amino acid N-acyltransferase YncA
MATLRVRDATPADARRIAEIHVAAWKVGYHDLVPAVLLEKMTVESRMPGWRTMLEGGGDAPSYVLVAESGDSLIGWCTVQTPARDVDATREVGELAGLYVHPDAWRTGAGRALTSEALQRLRAAGCTQVTAWVFEGNARARAFYATFGLLPDGTELLHAASGLQQIRLRSRDLTSRRATTQAP